MRKNESRGGSAEYLKTKGGFVLAGMEDVPYKEHTVTLHKNDVVFLYTDGVTEAENAKNELFGEDRLLACFANTDGVSAEQMIQTVKKSVDGFVNGHDQFDDITMLCFRLR